MDALLLALMTWINTASGLPMSPDPPHVSRVSGPGMAALARPRTGGGQDASAISGYLALYHADSATILLRLDWDRDNLRDLSILLHELVHHMQATSTRAYPCAGAREREAYELQARWLEEHDADLSGLLGMNGLFYYAVTHC